MDPAKVIILILPLALLTSALSRISLLAFFNRIFPTAPDTSILPAIVNNPVVKITTEPSPPDDLIPPAPMVSASISLMKIPPVAPAVKSLLADNVLINVSISSIAVPIPLAALSVATVVEPLIFKSVAVSPVRLSTIAPAVDVTLIAVVASKILTLISAPAVNVIVPETAEPVLIFLPSNMSIFTAAVSVIKPPAVAEVISAF